MRNPFWHAFAGVIKTSLYCTERERVTHCKLIDADLGVSVKRVLRA